MIEEDEEEKVKRDGAEGTEEDFQAYKGHRRHGSAISKSVISGAALEEEEEEETEKE